MNSALPDSPHVALQQVFFGLIDRFTEWHLSILKLVQSPVEWMEREGRALRQNSVLTTLLDAYPELEGQEESVEVVWADLQAAGLNDRSTTLNRGPSFVTDLGSQFLRFIKNPAAERTNWEGDGDKTRGQTPASKAEDIDAIRVSH
jgi:hypothetical protein